MWIKTEGGKLYNRLYNLQSAQAIEAVETDDGWAVTARYTR
jgi:hypothetical protein